MSTYATLFLSQFFEISSSAGSIFEEAINLVRTFQKLSTPMSFSIMFTRECLKLFNWAQKVIEDFTSSLVIMKPFSSFDLYTIYAYIFPIIILNYVTALNSGSEFPLYALTYGPFIVLGCGIGYIQINNIIAVACIIPSIIVIIIMISIYRNNKSCCLGFKPFLYLRDYFNSNDSKVQNDSDDLEESDSLIVIEQNQIPYTLSFTSTFIIFLLISYKVLVYREDLLMYTIIAISIIVFFTFCVELILYHCCHYITDEEVLIPIAVSLLQLLTIPATNNFTLIISGKYKKHWNCWFGYLGFLALQITIIFIMIRNNHPDIVNKYKPEKEWFKYFSFIDIIRQIVYAIFASLDSLYVCLCIECAWIIIIFVIRPFANISDYTLSCGSTFIVISSLIAPIIVEKKGYGVFSFKTSVILVFVACIPAVVSLYIYFIFDFDTEIVRSKKQLDQVPDEELTPKEYYRRHKIDSPAYKAFKLFSMILTLFFWFIFATNISLINDITQF